MITNSGRLAQCALIRSGFVRGTCCWASILASLGPALVCARSLFPDQAEPIRRQIEQREAQLQTLPVSPMNTCPWTLGYASNWHDDPLKPVTIRVIFPEPATIDLVALLPATYTDDQNQVRALCFPLRFSIERVLTDGSVQMIANHLDQDYEAPGISPQLFPCPNPVPASGLQITVTRRAPNPTWWPTPRLVALSELFAFTGERNAALNSQVVASSSFDFPYVWSPTCLTDGFSLYSQINHKPGDPTRNFSIAQDEVCLEMDLGAIHGIDELRLWPAVPSLQHNFPPSSGAGFPLLFKVELALTADFSDATLIYEEDKISQRPGAGPLMRRVAPAKGRFVRITLKNGFHDFRRSSDYLEITLSEIELLEDGKVVSGGAPVRAPSHPTGPAQLEKLTDGFVNEGEILPLRDWLTRFHRKVALERDLAALRTGLAVAQRADEKWSKTVLFIAIGLILALVQAIWWVRMASRRRWARMRERIACDLHDEIGANVSSIAHSAEMLLETIPEPTEIQASLLGSLIEVTRVTSHETKHFIRFIESEQKDRNLPEQFSRVAAQILGPIPVQASYLNPRSFNRLDPATKWNLLLFFKEALNNIIKHAKADSVEITARTDGPHFEIIVADDGCGLDLSVKSCRHLKSRAKMLGGLLNIHSQPGAGTRIHLRFKK